MVEKVYEVVFIDKAGKLKQTYATGSSSDQIENVLDLLRPGAGWSVYRIQPLNAGNRLRTIYA